MMIKLLLRNKIQMVIGINTKNQGMLYFFFFFLFFFCGGRGGDGGLGSKVASLRLQKEIIRSQNLIVSIS